MKIEDLLNYLDGRGIIFEDEELVIKSLSEIGYALFDNIEVVLKQLKKDERG